MQCNNEKHTISFFLNNWTIFQRQTLIIGDHFHDHWRSFCLDKPLHFAVMIQGEAAKSCICLQKKHLLMTCVFYGNWGQRSFKWWVEVRDGFSERGWAEHLTDVLQNSFSDLATDRNWKGKKYLTIFQLKIKNTLFYLFIFVNNWTIFYRHGWLLSWHL